MSIQTNPTAPTPEAFLAETSTEEDEELETFTGVLVNTGDPLESMAASLRAIVTALERPMAVRDAEAADARGEELRELGQAYDDLEAKHQSLYELLADVEKIVAKSKSQVSLEVKAAINEWRNPTVDEAATQTSPTEPAEAPPAVRDSHGTGQAPSVGEPPAADADLEVWREYARGRGVEGADGMNRSQIRTALGLSHIEG